jgi:uncharacterized protein
MLVEVCKKSRIIAVVGARLKSQAVSLDERCFLEPAMSATTTELEAAAFRRLLQHLNTRADVQNIDLMILAGFCRNCLSDWYREAAIERGNQISRDEARERVYGEPFAQWKVKHQKEATAEQLAAFEAAKKK